MSFWIGVVGFIVMLNVIVLVHESGHYLMARHYGMKVDEFFVGFGPRIWSFRRGETEYGVKWIFLGGYVKIAGMGPEELVPEEDESRTYSSKPARQRALTIAAGPLSHFAMAFVAAWILAAFIGPRQAVIGSIEPTLNGQPAPAVISGFQPGDVVIAIDGERAVNDDFIAATREHIGEPMTVTVERDGRTYDLQTTAVLAPILTSQPDSPKVGRLGVRLDSDVVVRAPVGPLRAIPEAGADVVELTKASVSGMARAFGPEGISRVGSLLFGDAERNPNDVVSTVGLARVAGDSAKEGNIDLLFSLFIALNVFIGLLNLIPLPPFDGGHLAAIAIEKVRGRPVDMRKMIPVSAVVLSFFALYTTAVILLDFVKPIHF